MAKLRCQWAGALAAVGGLVWVGWVLALQVTETDVTGTVSDPILAAIALSSVGPIAGHYAIEAYYGVRMKRPGVGGALLGVLGGIVFGIGQLLRILTDNGTLVVAIGVLALVAGSLMVATGMLRTRVQPPWIGVLLAFGTIAFLGLNIAPVTGVFYGLGWIALGQDLYRYDPPDGRFGEAEADYGWLSG